jgi:hypothetical protein
LLPSADPHLFQRLVQAYLDCRITRRKTVHVALDRLQDMPAAALHQSANSYFGLLRQATHSHHDRTRVAKLMLQRGHVVQGDITKIYRKKGSTNV